MHIIINIIIIIWKLYLNYFQDELDYSLFTKEEKNISR